MGLGPSKEKIRKILEKSMGNLNIKEQTNLKIEYKYNQGEKLLDESAASLSTSEGSNYSDNTGDSFNFSTEENQIITSPLLDVKNIKKYPYVTVGTVIVKFPEADKDEYYSCFLIDTNVVITLASNLEDNSKGGKAKSIITSFKDEKVKWENIIIQGEKKDDKKKENVKTLEGADNSKLAAILYEDNLETEWIGVEGGESTSFDGRDINCIFTLGLKDETYDGEKSKNNLKYREVNVTNNNPFDKLDSSSEEEDWISRCSPGSPVYYKDFNNGAYVIAVINKLHCKQFFDRETMVFLVSAVNKGKLMRKKTHKGIDEDNIVQLDLSRNDFGPLDIKYLTDFDLKNLRILDLSSNSIKPQGAFYLSQGKFSCLESLNLNFNEIGDEGLNHIANGFFSKLNYLYLFHNNISVEGIKHLVKAEFVNNLVILSLSENPNIGDTGIRIMKEHKGWGKLNTLNLNSTGLTDDALKYLGEASMPKLKKLNILGNKFTENGKPNINGLRMNHIHVSYRTQAEREKEKKKREKEKAKEKKEEKGE